MYKASWPKTSLPPSLNVRMKAQQKSVSIYHKGVTSLPIFMQNLSGSGRVANTFLGSFPQYRCVYRVVPKGLLASLDSLYKEIPKTTSGTLVYLFERQTARELFSSFEKHCVLDLECRIVSQEPSDSCICILMSYFVESKLTKISIDSWWPVNAVIIETVQALETWYSINLSGSNVIFKTNRFVLAISLDTIDKQ